MIEIKPECIGNDGCKRHSQDPLPLFSRKDDEKWMDLTEELSLATLDSLYVRGFVFDVSDGRLQAVRVLPGSAWHASEQEA